MARLFQSGFELNSNTVGVEWDVISHSPSIQSGTVRSGSYAGEVTSLVNLQAKGWGYQWLSSGANSNIYIRVYLNIATLPNHDTVIVGFGQSSPAATSPSVVLTTSGTLQLFNASVQIGSDSSALNTNQWYRIEVNFDKATGSTGVLELLVDGASQAKGTSISVGGTNTTVYFGGNLQGLAGTATTGDFFFDDIAINDTSGSTQTSYPGAGGIVHVQPNGAGDANSFPVQVGGTVGSTQNWTRVDEVTPDDATSYNASLTLNQEDLFTVGTSSVGGSDTVNVVALGVRFTNPVTSDTTTAIKVEIEKTSGGTKSQSASLIPNASAWHTNNRVVPRNYPLVTYQDPDGSAWTSTTLGTMQIGYKLTAANVNSVGVSTVWASIDYVGATGFAPKLSDSTTTSESISLLVTNNLKVSDSSPTSEFVDVLRALSRDSKVSDTATTSEIITLLSTSFINKSDSTTISETIHTEINDPLSVSDSTATSETVVLMADENLSVSDSTTTSESVTALITGARVSVSDSSVTSENISLGITGDVQINLHDSINTSESRTLALIPLYINVSDSTVTSESVAVLEPGFVIIVSDTTVTSESISLSSTDIDSVSDSTTTSESIGMVIESNINVSDSTTTSESINRVAEGNINVSDSTTTSEAQVVFIAILNTLIIFESDSTVTSESIAFGEDQTITVSDSTVTGELLVTSGGSVIVRSTSFSLTVPNSINFTLRKT